MKIIRLKRGRGKTQVNLFAVHTALANFVCLTGGKSHVGAVSAGLYGKWLNGVGGTLGFMGHRDDVLLHQVHKTVKDSLKGLSVTTAGVHYDGMTQTQIQSVIKNTEALTSDFMKEVGTIHYVSD